MWEVTRRGTTYGVRGEKCKTENVQKLFLREEKGSRKGIVLLNFNWRLRRAHLTLEYPHGVWKAYCKHRDIHVRHFVIWGWL